MGANTWLKSVHLCLTFVVVTSVMTSPNPVLETPLGRLRGTQETTADLPGSVRTYYAFRGIPFALPPVGDLRWKDPQEFGPWQGELDATKYADACPQLDGQSVSVMGSEDCLYLNVFVPALSSGNTFRERTQDTSIMPRSQGMGGASNLPVMVWIHGGAFIRGSSNAYGPQLLMREDVVLVTVNYRIGLLGFLSTGDSVIPGNFGLLDQIMALKWVNKYIQHFWGDPQLVTIFGESAGGASVHSLVLSPRAAGLFRHAIAQSGTALCDWSVNLNPNEFARQVGYELGCSLDSTSLLSCLKKKDMAELVKVAQSFQKHSFFPVKIAPVIDNNLRGGPVFLEHPKEILRKGRYQPVPLITGVLPNEGLFFYLMIHLENAGKMGDPKFLEHQLLPSVIQSIIANNTYEKAVTHAVKEQYFSGAHYNDPDSFIPRFSKMLDDGLFTSALHETLNLHSRSAAPVYGYVFSHRLPTSLSYSSAQTEAVRRMGIDIPFFSSAVSHADELFYFFQLPQAPKLSNNDLAISRMLTKMWATFAKTGSPTSLGTVNQGIPFWSRVVNPESINYFNISLNPTITTDFRKTESMFWTGTLSYVRELSARYSGENQHYFNATWILLALLLIAILIIVILSVVLAKVVHSRSYPEHGIHLTRSSERM